MSEHDRDRERGDESEDGGGRYFERVADALEAFAADRARRGIATADPDPFEDANWDADGNWVENADADADADANRDEGEGEIVGEGAVEIEERVCPPADDRGEGDPEQDLAHIPREDGGLTLCPRETAIIGVSDPRPSEYVSRGGAWIGADFHSVEDLTEVR